LSSAVHLSLILPPMPVILSTCYSTTRCSLVPSWPNFRDSFGDPDISLIMADSLAGDTCAANAEVGQAGSGRSVLFKPPERRNGDTRQPVVNPEGDLPWRRGLRAARVFSRRRANAHRWQRGEADQS
jgi:hypothetical protein